MTTLTLLTRHWRLIGIGLIFAILTSTTAYYRIDRDHWRKIAQVLRIDLDVARANTAAEIAKHEATKRAYADAQAEAERMEAERLARITAQQERINNERLASYSQRLAAARATADRLRQERASGAVGSTDCEQVPGAVGAGGTAGAACGDGFSLAQRVIATKQAIQLDELISVVEAQRGVR